MVAGGTCNIIIIIKCPFNYFNAIAIYALSFLILLLLLHFTALLFAGDVDIPSFDVPVSSQWSGQGFTSVEVLVLQRNATAMYLSIYPDLMIDLF